MDLKELKKEILQKQKEIAAAQKDFSKLSERQGELKGKLVTLDSAMGKVLVEQEKAVKQFARDEISEEQLDEVQKDISVINDKKKNISAALQVVEKTLSEMEASRNALGRELKGIENKAWKIIVSLEVAKLAEPLRRAYAAHKAYAFTQNNSLSFLNVADFARSLSDPVLYVSDDVFDKTAEELRREYL